MSKLEWLCSSYNILDIIGQSLDFSPRSSVQKWASYRLKAILLEQEHHAFRWFQDEIGFQPWKAFSSKTTSNIFSSHTWKSPACGAKRHMSSGAIGSKTPSTTSERGRVAHPFLRVLNGVDSRRNTACDLSLALHVSSYFQLEPQDFGFATKYPPIAWDGTKSIACTLNSVEIASNTWHVTWTLGY